MSGSDLCFTLFFTVLFLTIICAVHADSKQREAQIKQLLKDLDDLKH